MWNGNYGIHICCSSMARSTLYIAEQPASSLSPGHSQLGMRLSLSLPPTHPLIVQYHSRIVLFFVFCAVCGSIACIYSFHYKTCRDNHIHYTSLRLLFMHMLMVHMLSLIQILLWRNSSFLSTCSYCNIVSGIGGPEKWLFAIFLIEMFILLAKQKIFIATWF